MSNVNTEHDVFISYRRAGGNVLAKLIYETLKQKRYSVFFDHESIRSGVFSEKIIKTIRGAKDVIVVLSKNCLERCRDPEDWMLREVSEAIDAGKNLFLIFSEDFQVPTQQEKADYPEKIRKLLDYQGQTVSIAHFDDFIRKVTNGLDAKPLSFSDTEVKPAVSFLLDGGIDTLSEAETSGLMNQVLTSRYGEKLAGIMQSFVGSATGYYKNIRTRFQYEIDIDRRFPFGSIDIDASKYFRLSEMLSYQKIILEEKFEENFWIAYVLDLDQLDDSLKDEMFIFSENLRIDEKDLQTLIGLSEEDQMAFYCKHMRVRLNLNGKALQPVDLIIKETGIYANYRASESLFSEEKRSLDVKLAFSIPHRKVSGYFFASISDPTYSPYIRFAYPENEINVEMIPFMSRSTTAADTKIFDGLREISFQDEWVLPMSGAVFMVTPHEEDVI